MIKGNRGIKEENEPNDLQLYIPSCLSQLFSLAKTADLPNESLAKAWAALKDEYVET